MSENLKAITVKPKTGEENFTFNNSAINVKLLDFWKWSQADLVSNATRGVLAEFIVASALELDMPIRAEWDPYDLKTKKGLKIEVKSAAYLQSWYQEKLSAITFAIASTRAWDSKTNEYSGELKRQADIYIFCLLRHKDKPTIDPMNLDQWTFYILETSVLNEKLENQKSVSLAGLLKLNPRECTFREIKQAVDTLEKTYCR